jgi:hypothetical protein
VARSKKSASLLHPINTVMHWYAEAQTSPAQLKKNFEGEKEKALQLIKKLANELKQAKLLQKKARAAQVAAVKKMKDHSTKVSRALVKKAKAEYRSAAHRIERLTKEVKAAKTHLGHSIMKQKYFHALESAFQAVTKIFTKKHAASLHKKKSKKKRKMVVHHSAAVHRSKKTKTSHRKAASVKHPAKRVKKSRRVAASTRGRVTKHASTVRSHKRAIKKRATHRRK